MRLALYLVLIFGFLGCSNNHFNKKYEELRGQERIAREIRKKVALQMEREMGLRPIGTGGQMMYEIEKLMLAFRYDKEIGIEEGRELLLACVDTFISAVNEDERIHPYLKNYLFEPKNVEIWIFIQDPRGVNPGSKHLSVVSAIDGIMKYKIADDETDLLKTV